ncbi:pyruvate kinase [Candidatus Saccharibacteria bacterium]|nr:pyruvate kinase [Candidatus Saccharibacteria bacterium]MBQ3465044.1 pyruvate kinase [Candidatus Saccharibacteria bacterium]
MSRLFKRTKILATIGPSVFSAEKIEDLIMAGVNGCRLNFSHGDYTERDQQIKWIRDAAAKKGRSVAILQDLQGPKIRLGELKDNHFDVKAGDELILDSSVEAHDGSNILPVQYNLAERMKKGEPLFMFDGKIKSEVVEIVSKTAIKVKVENDGFLMSKKGLNLPETDFGGDVITEKDMADIEFGASRDFDYVAMSFVQSAEDIEKLRQILLSHGSNAQIIAKIETKKAIESDEKMEAIVKATDGIMVARGDMAVEAGNEVVPIVQRKLIALCRQYGKIVIVATQMMGSMVDNPEPSRAEVSDVANAVIQGADAVMLSDETANGKYPVEAVKEMKKVILYTQNHSKMLPIEHETTGIYKSYDAVAEAAAKLAEKIEADVIVCETSSGATAAAIAAQRPNVPIISVTSNARVAGQLALTYANSAFVRPFSETYGLDLAQELSGTDYLKKREDRDYILAVIVSGQPNMVGGTDTIRIRQVIGA